LKIKKFGSPKDKRKLRNPCFFSFLTEHENNGFSYSVINYNNDKTFWKILISSGADISIGDYLLITDPDSPSHASVIKLPNNELSERFAIFIITDISRGRFGKYNYLAEIYKDDEMYRKLVTNQLTATKIVIAHKVIEDQNKALSLHIETIPINEIYIQLFCAAKPPKF